MESSANPAPWLKGEKIYENLGMAVVKRPVADGSGFEAVKCAGNVTAADIDMIQYITSNTSVKTPRFRSIIEPPPGHTVRGIVMDFVPGQTLDKIWPTLRNADKTRVKKQLQEQILLLRKCTVDDFIGRVGKDRSVRDMYNPFQWRFIGPFKNEKEFDHYKAQQLAERYPQYAAEFEAELERLRISSPSSTFVLTHGDLSPHNIMVQRQESNGRWEITGLLDWETSGFYPEYLEYSMAVLHGAFEHEWRMFIKVALEEIGLGFPVERLRVEANAIKYLFGPPHLPFLMEK